MRNAFTKNKNMYKQTIHVHVFLVCVPTVLRRFENWGKYANFIENENQHYTGCLKSKRIFFVRVFYLPAMQ